jgi:hypothetical protein
MATFTIHIVAKRDVRSGARDKPDHDCGQEAGVGRNEMVVGLEYGISSGPISHGGANALPIGE